MSAVTSLKNRSLSVIREGFYRLLAQVLREKQSEVALPVLSGPARGLWLRRDLKETATTEIQSTPSAWSSANVRTERLAVLCQRGWTVWDCGSETGLSTIYFARFIGEDGMVVSFEPSRPNFMRTFDNATLNGCHNILFLFAGVGAPCPKKAFLPPICARQMSLDEAYQDDEIPVPQLVRIDLTGNGANALNFVSRLVREQKPLFIVDHFDAQGLNGLQTFAAEQAYELRNLETDKPFESGAVITGSVLAVPKE